MIQPGELLNTSLGWDGCLLWVLPPPPLNNMSDFPDNLPPPILLCRERLWEWSGVSCPRTKHNGLASVLCHLKSSVQTLRSTSLTLPKDFFLHSILNLSFILQQTHLLNPSLIELGLKFYIATASWLNQVALAGDSFDEMTSFKEVEIPLPTEVGMHPLRRCTSLSIAVIIWPSILEERRD